MSSGGTACAGNLASASRTNSVSGGQHTMPTPRLDVGAYDSTFYVELPHGDSDFGGSAAGLLGTILEDTWEDAGSPWVGAIARTHSAPLSLSTRKLKRLEPGLSGAKGACNSVLARLCCFLPPTHRLQEHLIFGDSNPAIVVQEQPLIVAAYAAPLDCVALLRFGNGFLCREYDLKVGSRLLTLNTYKRKQRSLDSDLVPGPKARVTTATPAGPSQVGRSAEAVEYGNPLYETEDTLGQAGCGQLLYSGFYPIIADFVTDDASRLRTKKERIEDAHWRYVLRLGLEKLQRSPNNIRDGRPNASDHPISEASDRSGRGRCGSKK